MADTLTKYIEKKWYNVCCRTFFTFAIHKLNTKHERGIRYDI